MSPHYQIQNFGFLHAPLLFSLPEDGMILSLVPGVFDRGIALRRGIPSSQDLQH